MPHSMKVKATVTREKEPLVLLDEGLRAYLIAVPLGTELPEGDEALTITWESEVGLSNAARWLKCLVRQ